MQDVLKMVGYVVYCMYVLTSLWLLVNGLIQLHLLWHYKRRRRKERISLPSILPFVTVQLPVYNEKYVVAGLFQCMGNLDYPKDKLEIQVLDDSTDETSSIVDREVKDLQTRGIDATIIRRNSRQGFKAGALQEGLGTCKGELIAIFDADFRPEENFLKRLVPQFSNEQVGMVQARWSHYNQNENALTHIQSFLLDTHFSIEQSGRTEAGYFTNFCGTAGIWRKQCIEEAGGWDGTVLSEDLDLSYRAQLKGWKLVYDETTEVPAELPSVLEAFKIQQFRWTKGMAQTSRKLLSRVLQARLSFSKKLHGVFQLLGSFVFVCLFINALLTVPLLLLRNWHPEFITLTHYSLFTCINLIALTILYYNGAKSRGTNSTNQFFTYYPLFLLVYMGLSVQNTFAVLEGFSGKQSPFVRTPKFNLTKDGLPVYLHKQITWINIIELITLLYFLCGIVISFYLNDYFMLLFFVMFSYGLGFIIYQTYAPFYKQKFNASGALN